MPTEVTGDKYLASIPKFTLPPDLTNKPIADKPAVETPPAEAPKEEPKPVAEAATPPETPVAEETEETKETAKSEEPEKKSESRFERRINRAKQRELEAKAEAERLARELAEVKSRSAPVQDPTEPKMSDFSDIAEYGKAMREWGEKKAQKDLETKQREESGRKFTQDLTSQWASQVGRGEDEYDDWEEVVGDLKPTAPWAVAIMQEENGYKVAHYLGKHPKEAQRIVGLDPFAQIREIVKLGVKLQSPPAAPKKPSAAPPPITPVTGTGEVKKEEVRPNQPFEEYMAIGNKMFRGRI